MSINFTKVPFEEAIRYFRDKVKLPTETWTDIWQGMHSRAFVVAGATKNELLSDFYTAIDRALQEGTTIADFRKAFDETVARNGWSYKGERGWRTGVIFDTNMRTAYAAGNYRQMMAVREARPYWRYLGGLSETPRQLHLKWSGTVLRYDDPWWDTHYPPNDWGCKCEVTSHPQDEIDALKKEGVQISTERPNNGTYQWTDKQGNTHTIPNGIGPGWAYNPGKAAWGETLSEDVMNAWREQGAKAWEKLTPGDWKSYNRDTRVTLDDAGASIDYTIPKTYEGMESALRTVLGGDEKVFSFQAEEFRYDTLVNAKTLAGHIDPNRAPYIPFIHETMTDPFEVWLSFERHKGTEQVVLRQRVIKAINTGGKEGIVMVANAVKGSLESWTFIPIEDVRYLNKQRVGKLLWKREG